MVGYFGNVRTSAAVGTLLEVPFLFVYWAFISSTTVNTALLNGYFWRAALTGALANLGHGVVSVCAVGYVAKSYSASHNAATGKVVGTFFTVAPLATLVYVLMLCAYGSSLNSAVVGACLAVVSAVLWYVLVDPVSENEGEREAWGMWEQTQRFLVMLAPLGASVTFAAFAGVKTVAGGLSVAFMATLTSVFAFIGALVFFGWGFDGCRSKAGMVWNFLAVVTTLLVLLEGLGVIGNLVVLTISLCHVVSLGGFVFYVSHMLYNSDHSEVNTTAAAFTLVGAAGFVVTLVLCFFGASVFPIVVLAVLTLLAVCLNV